jgi:hypothetical protein
MLILRYDESLLRRRRDLRPSVPAAGKVAQLRRSVELSNDPMEKG